MKRNLKAVLAGAVGLAFAGSGLLALASPAFAAGGAVPPWEPDGNAAAPYGNITFYDAAGNPVTSGTNLGSPFAYAVATTPADAGSTKASIYFASPVHGQPPSAWTVTQESGSTTFSPATSLPAVTPADVKAFAPTYPVVSSTGNINTWLAAGNGSDTNAGFANTIQVRLQDTLITGTTTYWDTDIAFNNTASPVTIAEPSPGSGTVTVPANSWVQLFPNVTASTTTLTTSATAGHVITGDPITLTATVPSADAGSVNFFDGTTLLGNSAQSGGTATFTYTPAAGNHSYTASFIPGPPPGDESGLNTASAAIVDGSTSAAVAISDTPPQVSTSTSLSASSTSINFGASDTFTATVTSSDGLAAGVAGSVQFFDGSTSLGSQATTVSGTSGTAALTTSSLPQGSNSITAVFTPTSNSYANSTSAPVVVTVAAPAACSLTGSSCSDTQNIQVTVNPGTITITTPYTATNPFVLPDLTLSSDGTFFQSSATFPAAANPASQQIVVTSSLAPAYAWTLSVAATPLTTGGGGTIPASGLGLTNGALLNATGPGAYPGSVTFTGIPAHNPSPVDTDTNSGLGTVAQTFAHSTAADGTAVMDGTLTLLAATNTPSGTYTGTITFSVS